MDATKRQETLGPETKDLASHGPAGSTSVKSQYKCALVLWSLRSCRVTTLGLMDEAYTAGLHQARNTSHGGSSMV